MNRRTLFTIGLATLWAALTRPAKAISESDGAGWLPMVYNGPNGPEPVLVWAKRPQEKGSKPVKTI